MNRLRSMGGAGPRLLALLLPLPLLLLDGSAPLQAQGGGELGPGEEARELRRANGHEWRGELGEAETVLRELLAAAPTSTGGLFALERVTRARGRLAEVLPFADHYLEREPGASGVRSMKLRVLAEIDSTEALRPTAEAWLAAAPESRTPWREVARVWRETFGISEAIALLERGRSELGDSVALALELGDLHAEAGDAPAAVREWSRAARDPEVELGALRRRIERLGPEPASWAGPLLASLVADPEALDRREAAVRIALDLGLPDRAAALSRSLTEDLAGGRRARFLEDLAGEADEAGAVELRLWALTTRRADQGGGAAPRLDLQIASAALAAGDTALAVEAQGRLARSLPVGSAERRGAIADLIRVEAGTAAAETLRMRLDGFRAEYPGAPELDGLTARVVAGLAARGEAAAAEALVSGELPGALTRLERGYLRLGGAEGEEERTAGIADLEAALAGLPPERATGVLQLLTSLERTSPSGARALGAAEATAHRNDPVGALHLLEATLPEVDPEDRPVLLAAAARYALAAKDTGAAEMYLDALVGGFEQAPERPEAMLRLARLRAATPDGREDALRLLEELILEAPEGAIVPAARRELQRIRANEIGG